VVCAGEIEGRALLTCTAPWALADVAWRKPAARYLGHLAAGLVEAGAWEAGTIAEYLAARPGAAGEWSVAQIAALMEGEADDWRAPS
jgi:hypothetical protein